MTLLTETIFLDGTNKQNAMGGDMSAMYVVQSFTSGKKGQMLPDSPVQAQNTNHARRIAERLAVRKALVVAFMREGNPTTGEWEDARLIAAFGDIPDEVREMEGA